MAPPAVLAISYLELSYDRIFFLLPHSSKKLESV
jgi:hypothetical protein